MPDLWESFRKKKEMHQFRAGKYEKKNIHWVQISENTSENASIFQSFPIIFLVQIIINFNLGEKYHLRNVNINWRISQYLASPTFALMTACTWAGMHSTRVKLDHSC